MKKENKKKAKILSLLATTILVFSVVSVIGTSVTGEEVLQDDDETTEDSKFVMEGEETTDTIEDNTGVPELPVATGEDTFGDGNPDEKRYVGPWPRWGGDRRNTGRSEHNTSGVDGTLEWEYDEGDNFYSSSPVIGPDGTIYAGDTDVGIMHAIDPSDGSQEWTFDTDGWIFGTPTVGGDGTVYFGSYDDTLYALNPDGTEKWSYSTAGSVQVTPAIGPDNTIYFGCFGGYFYALDAEDGSEKWVEFIGDSIWGEPAIDEDGNIYFGSDDGHAYSYTADGEYRWSYFVEDADARYRGVRRGPTIADDGTLYFGVSTQEEGTDGPGYLLAMTQDGEKEWDFQVDGWSVSSTPTVDTDGTIYFSDQEFGITYALNPDGSVKWEQATGAYGSGVTIGQDGTLYLGSQDTNVYALNPEDGSTKWSYSTGSWIVYSSAGVNSDGTVYIGSGDGSLYAFRNTLVPPRLDLTTDLEDELLYPGEETNITWDTLPGSGEITDLDLKYTTDGGYTWDYIEKGLDDTGEYEWTVPEEPSPEARIRIRVHDDIYLSSYDMSESFQIYTHPPESPENLTVTHATETTIFHDDVEEGDLGYTTGEWALFGDGISNPPYPCIWEIRDTDAYVGNYSWEFGDPDGFSRVRDVGGSESWMISPEISLIGLDLEAEPELSFAHWRDFRQLYDGGNLQISTEADPDPEAEEDWEIIEPREGYDGVIEPDPQERPNPNWGDPAWGFQEDWERVHFDLTDYVGEEIHLKWSASIAAGPFGGYEGWRVDDIRIETEETAVGGMNNLLRWDASYDDFAGNESVTHYNIYRADSEDGPWNETTLIDFVEAEGIEDEYTYTDVGAGFGTEEYWYVVRAVDFLGQNDTNEEAVKEVVPPVIDVTSPSEDEMLYPGEVETITWETVAGDGDITDVDLMYSTDGGRTWYDIKEGLDDTGEYNWTIPEENSDIVRVRGVVHDDLGIRSASLSEMFHIVGDPPGDIDRLRAQNYVEESVFYDDASEDKGYITDNTIPKEWNRSNEDAYVGDYSWDFTGDLDEEQGGASWLISPEIDLDTIDHPTSGAELTFRLWQFDTVATHGVNLRISTEGTDGPWEVIWPEYRRDGEGMYDRIAYSEPNPMAIREEPYWNQDRDWELATFDLDEYVGETIHLNWTAGLSDFRAYGHDYRIDDIRVNLETPAHSTDDSHLLSWDASPDDGEGDDSVDRYEIYRTDEDGENKTYLDSIEADGSEEYHEVIPLPPESPTDLDVVRYEIEEIFHDPVDEDKGYTTGEWEGASEWDIRDHGAYVGDQSWDFADDVYNRPEDAGLSWLISPEIHLEDDLDEAELRFHHWRDMIGNMWEGGNVKITVEDDPGEDDWEIIEPEERYDSGTFGDFYGQPLAGEPGWSESSDWEQATFDLDEYIGETVQFNWSFGAWDEGGAGFDEYEGWRIDNITVEGEKEMDEGSDNMIYWDASPDDSPEGTVDQYNIYRSESSDGPWDETTFIDTVEADYSESYSYLDPDKGAADDVLWWYNVRAEEGIRGQDCGNDNPVQEPDANDDEGTYDIQPSENENDEEYWYTINTVDVHGQVTEYYEAVQAVDPPYIELTSPIGGEELYYVDETKDITWDAESVDGEITEIELEYTDDGGESWYIIDTVTEDTDVYEWDLPDVFSDEVRVRASVHDDNLHSWNDESGTFEIIGSPPASPVDLEVDHYADDLQSIYYDPVDEDKGYTTGTSEDVDASEWDIRDHDAYVGDQSWDFGDGNYTDHEPYLSWLKSPQITIPDLATNPRLTFDHWFDFNEYNIDGGNLKITTEEDPSEGDWELIRPEEGYTRDVWGGAGHPLAGEDAFVYDQHDWEEVTFELDEYIGEDVYFRWDVGIDDWSSGDTDEGWRVDNIEIEAQLPIEAGEHNVLSWGRSEDDGFLRDTVTEYNIYRSRYPDGAWNKIETVTADESLNYIYIDENAGDFDYTRWWYKVRPEDKAGQLDEEPIDPVQEPAAELSVEITDPADEEVFTTSQVTVEWDSTGQIDYYLIRIDDENWIYKGHLSYHNFIDLDDDTYEAEVRAVAEDGETVDDSVSFTVDTKLPTLEITNPEDGIENLTYDEEFTIEGQTESENTVYIDGEEVDVDDEGAFEYNITLMDGLNIFEVRAEDPEGKVTETNVYALYLPQIPELWEEIDHLEDDIEDNKDAISELEDELDARVEELEDALEENVTALEDRIETLESDISAIEDRFDQLEADLEKLESDISALEDNVGEIEDKIEAIEDEIEALEADIEAIEDEIEAIEDEIEALEDRLEEVEKDEEEETPGFTLIPMVLVAAVLAVAIYYKKQQ